MSKKTRKDIIELIAAGIEFDILKEGKISPDDSPQFESLVKDKATTMLEKYERSVLPRFWYGAWQGVAGNFIWLFLLAALGFILAMCSLNIWDLMIDSIAEKLKTTP